MAIKDKENINLVDERENRSKNPDSLNKFKKFKNWYRGIKVSFNQPGKYKRELFYEVCVSVLKILKEIQNALF